MTNQRLLVVAFIGCFLACSKGNDEGGAGGSAGQVEIGGAGGSAGHVDDTGGIGGQSGTGNVGGSGGGVPGELSCVHKLFTDCGGLNFCQVNASAPQHYCFAGGPTADVARTECKWPPSIPAEDETHTVVTVRNASGGLCFTIESVCYCSSACEITRVTWKNASGEVVATGVNDGPHVEAKCELDSAETCRVDAPGPGGFVGDSSCIPTFPPPTCTTGTCP
jgi:hypothetical protein